MGYMRSHAIVVESWNNEMLIAAHNFAASLFPWVSPISPLAINAMRSFFVPSAKVTPSGTVFIKAVAVRSAGNPVFVVRVG
jgi:hypothetical protein